MVYINDQKFSCESCIKGHRSSSCTHNDRPLFEVKKKGRPVSQCEKCRELRKNKRVHAKCICATEKPEKSVKPLCPKSSTKRFIPILPSLPNGLKDAFASSNQITMPPADPRARVDNLLNPCHCDVWNCKCDAADAGPVASCSRATGCSGLDTLASAAASLCCISEAANTDQILDRSAASPAWPVKHGRDNGKPSPKSKNKRLRRQSPPQCTPTVHERGPVLPPILQDAFSAASLSAPPPAFPVIPPLSSIVSLAGTGCTCGFDCNCPGCVEHRGSEYASHEHDDCPDGCGTCVDNEHGVELPASTPFGCVPSSSSAVSGPDFLEAFFAKAAAIPPPPPERAFARTLDLTNVTVYPASLFAGEARTLDERGRAFGLVRVPKLECCAGRCGCPGDTCGCGENCDGCCSHEDGDGAAAAAAAASASAHNADAVVEEIPPPVTEEVRSCCAGKGKAIG